MSLIFKINDVKNEYIGLKERGLVNYLYASIDFSAYQERYIIERIIAYYSYKSDDFIPHLPPQAEYFTLNDPTFYIINMYNSKYKIPRRYECITLNTVEETYEKYLSDGGPVIKQEEIDNPDFQKLYDKNFVLTGQAQ